MTPQGPPGTPETRNGPGLQEAQDHPASNSPAKAAETIAVKDDVMLTIIGQAADVHHDVAGRRRFPLAFASQAAPCAGRTQWHVMYQCEACGCTHFGRSPIELTTGKRTARCGRVVWLVIARTYRGRSGAGVAA